MAQSDDLRAKAAELRAKGHHDLADAFENAANAAEIREREQKSLVQEKDYTYGNKGNGFADREADYYRDQAQYAQGRNAFQANYKDANAWQAASVEARGQQQDALGLARGAAMGTAPSQAELLSRANMDRAASAQASLAAGARGPAALALAQQQAAAQTANAQTQINQQAYAGRAAEMADARNSYAAQAAGIRGGDQASQAQAANQAQYQSNMKQANRAQNDSTALAYEGNRGSVYGQNLQGSQNKSSQGSANYWGEQNFQQQKAENEKNRSAARTNAYIGAAGNAAGALSDERAKKNVQPLSMGELASLHMSQMPAPRSRLSTLISNNDDGELRSGELGKVDKATNGKGVGDFLASAMKAGGGAMAGYARGGASMPGWQNTYQAPHLLSAVETKQPISDASAAKLSQKADTMRADEGAKQKASLARGPSVGKRPSVGDIAAAGLRRKADSMGDRMKAGHEAALAQGPAVGSSLARAMGPAIDPNDPIAQEMRPPMPLGPVAVQPSIDRANAAPQFAMLSDERAKRDAYNQGRLDGESNVEKQFAKRFQGGQKSVATMLEGAGDEVPRQFGVPSPEEQGRMTPTSTGDPMEDYLATTKPALYEYKDPNMPGASPGPQIGPASAQKMEKTAVGSTVVDTDPRTGLKAIDGGKALKTTMSAVSHVNDKVNKLDEVLTPLRRVLSPYQGAAEGLGELSARSAARARRK